MDALSLILEAFDPVAGRAILDIGCGHGGLARTLASRGAIVSGIDPNALAISAARQAVPDASFLAASAEALPFREALFDGVVLLNSLHHVPAPRAALREAARVLRPAGRIVVVEPLARGSSFEALRPIEDETAVRSAAQDAIAAVLAGGEFRCERDTVFERLETFDDVERFLERVAAVDAARLDAIWARRTEILATIDRVAERGVAGRYILRQPLRAHVLATIPPRDRRRPGA